MQRDSGELPEPAAAGGRDARAMAQRDGGGRGLSWGLPRLLLWLALCGLWRGGEAGTLPARGAALPFRAGSPAACSPRCQHGGLCLGNGTCLCSKGYEGERCQHGNGPASPCGRGAPGSRWVGRPAGRSGVRPRGDGRKKRGAAWTAPRTAPGPPGDGASRRASPARVWGQVREGLSSGTCLDPNEPDTSTCV